MVVPVPIPTPASSPKYSVKWGVRASQAIEALEKQPIVYQKINSLIRSLPKQPYPDGTFAEETDVGVIFNYQIKEVKYEITYSVRGEVIQILRVDPYVAEM